MFATPARPPKRRKPLEDGPELHVHPQRTRCGIAPQEQALVLIFLARYIVWRAKRREHDQVRDILGLFAEVASTR